MSNTIRAALERLVNAVDVYDATGMDVMDDAIAAARAALAAEPVGEGPILRWTDNNPPCEDCRFDHCTAETPFGRFLISWKGWKQFNSPTVDESPWGDWYEVFNSVDAAKAACQREMDKRLARWGRPATPPAPEPGEVGELVEFLQLHGTAQEAADTHWARPMLRAATLLQQLSAPAPAVVPVAVADRLPGEGDCDPSNQCWWFTPSEEKWIFWPLKWAGPECSHWLPAHAIPLPQAGEGEA